MTQEFPLKWPKAKERTMPGERRHSVFSRLAWTSIIRDAEREIELLGGTDAVLSCNQPINKNGTRSEAEYAMQDPGAAVRFQLEGMAVNFAADMWLTPQENIRAIGLHLEAMRGQERWGVGTKRQAFSGYAALAVRNVEEWRVVLGFGKFAIVDRKDIQSRYHELSRDVHPDRGGTPEAQQRLNEARDRALQEVGK